jgi:hypothetical protein
VDRETAPVKSALSGPNQEPRSPNVELIGWQSLRQWLSFLGLRTVARCVEKLRTVLPLTVGVRDGAVHLVSTLGVGGGTPARVCTELRSQNVISNGCQAETVVGLPWAADSCPWVGKLRTVLPLSDVIRDSAVQLSVG